MFCNIVSFDGEEFLAS